MIRTIVVFAVIALTVGSVEAGTLAEKREELTSVLRQLTQHRAQLRKVQKQEHQVLGQLEGIDRSRDAASRRLATLAVELRQSQARVQLAEVRLAATRRELSVRQARLRTRLRHIYKYGQGGYLEVLLGTADFAEFVTRWHLISTIMRADRTLVTETESEATRYEYLQETLQADTAYLGSVIAQTEANKRELEVQEQAKRTLLRRVQWERAAYEQAVRELEANSRDLQILIKQLQASPTRARVALARGVGALLWPARGQITSGFGIRRHPLFGIQHMHTGVDIGATWGSPVLAAADGQVIHTGWFGGYGKIVILDHGGGVSTLYAHLFEILVAPGASVRRGQVVGRVGSTGYATGPHLHFEVRVDGQPIDPTAY